MNDVQLGEKRALRGVLYAGRDVTLGERAMLGDTGSNLIGAIAGVWLLTTLGADARLIALAAVLMDPRCGNQISALQHGVNILVGPVRVAAAEG